MKLQKLMGKISTAVKMYNQYKDHKHLYCLQFML